MASNGDEDVREILEEYADEYGVDVDIIEMLYEMMPEELYDGLVNELEDISSNGGLD